YQEGLGTYEDIGLAAKWYKKSALQTYVLGQFNLGNLYRRGEGLKQDDEKACYWYRKAAEQGFPAAQNALGYMYAEGRGVKQDKKQAADWFKKAVRDLASARKNLARLKRKSGTFSLVNLKVDRGMRSSILSQKEVNLSAWLEVDRQLLF
ncbi:MAG: tetratricopeptide repeat protein, partial [Mariprofundaceae bacterium]